MFVKLLPGFQANKKKPRPKKAPPSLESEKCKKQRTRHRVLPKVIGYADPAELRQIKVSSVFQRLFHCIIGRRLESSLLLSERQKGFRKGDGLFFNTQLLKNILETTWSRCQNLAMAFVDVKKAFNSISHETLWKACRWIGIPNYLVLYLKQCYKGSTVKLKLEEGLSEEIATKRGIKQEDPLSVYLFNTVMELCAASFDKKIGVDCGGKDVSYLMYADYLAKQMWD